MPSENAIIERAETYLRKLSCGVNPLTGELLPEGDACKQERISKCLAYVASLLQKQLDHSDIAGQDSTQAATTAKVGKPEKSEKAEKKAAKAQMVPLAIDSEMLSRYRFFDYPVSISRMVRNINELLPRDVYMNHLLYADVANFLVQEGILSRQATEDGKEANLPTPCSRSAGRRPSSTSWTTSRNASHLQTSDSRTGTRRPPAQTNKKAKSPRARNARSST